MKELLAQYLSFSGALFWINFMISVAVIFHERKSPTSTMLWVMAIMYLPIVGVLLYLILGVDISKSETFDNKRKYDELLKAHAIETVKEINEGKYKYHDLKSYEYEGLIKLLSNNNLSKYTEENDVQIITDGKEFQKDLLEEFQKAKYAIFFEFYIIKSGEFLDSILDCLIQKAKEGVQVKILVDGMGGRNLKKKDIEKMKAAGIEFAVFFPPTLGLFNIRLNFRNHRKIVVVDNELGYIGGFNIGDEYLGKSKKFGYWRDTHLKIRGEAVNDLTNRFYADYKFASGKSDGRFQTLVFHKRGDVAAHIVTSGPDHTIEMIRDGFSKLIESAKKRIYIQTPYFIPDEGLFKSLRMAAYSGIDVRIMVPAKPDHPFVKSASRSYLGDLTNFGAKVYYYKDEGFLHAKTILVDDFLSTVGTANFDIRSFKLNFEINAFIYDYGVNTKLAENFEEDMKKSELYTFELHQKRAWNKRFMESIARLLSPIL